MSEQQYLQRIRECLYEITTAEMEKRLVAELVEAEHRGEAKALNELRHVVAELKTIEKENMVTADKLKASSDALTEAVTGAIALIPNGTPASTPDATVLAFQSDVDAQTARLAAAEKTVVPTPTPAPTPTPVPTPTP